jgi:ribose 5-phosphate isomerase B
MSSPSWTVAIGADEAGFDYKKIIKADLEKDPRVKSVIDVGVNEGTDKTAYPHVGVAAARAVAEGKADRAIIICGTGMGVAISACKVPGIRVSHSHQARADNKASVAHDSFSVERLVLSNNGQVLALGQRVIGVELARRLVKEFLGHVFDESSPSAAKVAVIGEYEQVPGDCK